MRDPQDKRRRFFTASRRGISLVEVALFIMTLGLVIIVSIKIYDHRALREKVDVTAKHVEMVQEAVKRFKARNFRLPRPAPMDAPPDGVNAGGAIFGKEIPLANKDDNSTAALKSGTTVIAGRDPDAGGPILAGLVRTGTVPVRSLNLPDEAMLDGWGHRLLYAVTQEYATYIPPVPPDPITDPFNYDRGAITLRDANLNSSTSISGNVVYALVANGSEDRGAYGFQGTAPAVACAANATLGENCFNDPTPDATFSNTMLLKGDSTTASGFAYSVGYEASLDHYMWWTDNPSWDRGISPCYHRNSTATTLIPFSCWSGKQFRTVECRKGGKPGNVGFQFCTPVEPQNPNWLEVNNCVPPPAIMPNPNCQWNTSWSGCSSLPGCGPGIDTPTSDCRRIGDNALMPDLECASPPGPPGFPAKPIPVGCCISPCCGSPPGCGGTYAGACGESCSEPACPPPPPPPPSSSSSGGSGSSSSSGGSGTSSGGGCNCGPDPGCDTGNYADDCGDPNGCTAPACPCTCNDPAGCDGGTYNDSCGNPNCTDDACPTPPSSSSSSGSGCSGTYTYMNCFNWGCTAGGALAWYDAICCVQCDGNFITDYSTPGYSQLVTHDTSLCGSPELSPGWDYNYAYMSCCILQYDGSLACSDKRLKKNITPIPEGTLEKILALKPVTFDWKNPSMGSGKQIGLIAQDVEKVYPEMVEEGPDGIKKVHYQFLGPLLIKALAETNAKIKLLVAINILLALGLLLAVFMRRKK